MKHITVQPDAAIMLADLLQTHGFAIAIATFLALIGAYVFSEKDTTK